MKIREGIGDRVRNLVFKNMDQNEVKEVYDLMVQLKKEGRLPPGTKNFFKQLEKYVKQ